MQIRMLVTQFQTNTYVILGERTVIIDPGGSSRELLELLAGLGRKPDFVLVTHGHYDHVYSCAELERLGAKIFMSKKDSYLVENGGHLGSMGITVESFNYENVVDGQTLIFGDLEFLVMSTPGHTPGGVCYICGDHIFSGDTLFHRTIGRTDFPGGSMTEMRSSLKSFLHLGRDYAVLPGHGESTTVESEQTMLRRMTGA